MTVQRRQTIFRSLMIAVLTIAFVIMFYPFLGEILLAAVFAWAMEPMLGRLLRGRYLRWRMSVALILFGMFLLLSVPVSVVIYKIYDHTLQVGRTGFQNTEFFKQAIILRDVLAAHVNSLIHTLGGERQFDFSILSEQGLGRFGNLLIGWLTSLAARVPSLLLSIFVFCAALYYFLAEAKPIKDAFLKQEFLTAHESRDLIRILQDSSFRTVVSSFVIGIFQAFTIALGALIFHAGDVVIVFVITFFCSFIPVIGASPVALVLAAYKFILGAYGQGIGLVVVATIAGTVDNLVRPYLVRSPEGDIHPVVSLLAIIGAILVFGMPGLFLGPVLATVTWKVLPLLLQPRRVARE